MTFFSQNFATFFEEKKYSQMFFVLKSSETYAQFFFNSKKKLEKKCKMKFFSLKMLYMFSAFFHIYFFVLKSSQNLY